VLDSAALASCFFTGVACVLRPDRNLLACLAFSGASSSTGWDSFGAPKQPKHDRNPPLAFFAFTFAVDPSVCSGAGWGTAAVFSEVAGRCPERLLLAVLPALRLPMKLRFEPRPMLSEESATVAPLKPVLSSCDCAVARGMLRNDRFFFGSASDASFPPSSADLAPDAPRSSVDGCPREGDRGGGSSLFGLDKPATIIRAVS
jgi:hypothetical protein